MSVAFHLMQWIHKIISNWIDQNFHVQVVLWWNWNAQECVLTLPSPSWPSNRVVSIAQWNFVPSNGHYQFLSVSIIMRLSLVSILTRRSLYLQPVLPNGQLPSGIPTRTFYTLPFSPICMLHALHIIHFLILSFLKYLARNTNFEAPRYAAFNH
jgi:hypothetical protein